MWRKCPLERIPFTPVSGTGQALSLSKGRSWFDKPVLSLSKGSPQTLSADLLDSPYISLPYSCSSLIRHGLVYLGRTPSETGRISKILPSTDPPEKTPQIRFDESPGKPPVGATRESPLPFSSLAVPATAAMNDSHENTPRPAHRRGNPCGCPSTIPRHPHHPSYRRRPVSRIPPFALSPSKGLLSPRPSWERARVRVIRLTPPRHSRERTSPRTTIRGGNPCPPPRSLR